MARPKGSKNKKKNMPEEKKEEVQDVSAPSGFVPEATNETTETATSEVGTPPEGGDGVPPEEVKEIVAPTFIDGEDTPNTRGAVEEGQGAADVQSPAEDGASGETASLEGFTSCTRCGRDESDTVTLVVVGNEKLCNVCRA